jgi:CrcB protein
MIRLRLLGLIFLGGAIGSLARWGLQSLAGHDSPSFALATLGINTAGVFAMALVAPWTARQSPEVRGLVTTGFFGGLTTFSAVMLLLVSPAATWSAVLFVAVSIAAAWTAGALGSAAGGVLWRRLA